MKGNKEFNDYASQLLAVLLASSMKEIQITEEGQLILRQDEWFGFLRNPVSQQELNNKLASLITSLIEHFLDKDVCIKLLQRLMQIVEKTEAPFSLPTSLALEQNAPVTFSFSEAQAHSSERACVLPIQKEGRFYNYPGESLSPNKVEVQYVLGMKWRNWWAPQTQLDDLVGAFVTKKSILSQQLADDPVITWCGHAFVMIQVHGLNILVDPVIGKVPPFFAPNVPDVFTLKNMPCPHIVAITHNHRDHADTDLLKHLVRYQPLMVAGLGSEDWLKTFGFKKVRVLNWWQSCDITTPKSKQQITLQGVPAAHGSRTGVSNANKMLWLGFVLQVGLYRILILGDTARGKPGSAKWLVDQNHQPQDFVQQIQDELGPFDVAFCPVGPPDRGFAHNHVDAKEAIEITQILTKKNATTVVPYHDSSKYCMGMNERPEEPMIDFMKQVNAAGLNSQVLAIKMGAPFLLTLGGLLPYSSRNEPHSNSLEWHKDCISPTLWGERVREAQARPKSMPIPQVNSDKPIFRTSSAPI